MDEPLAISNDSDSEPESELKPEPVREDEPPPPWESMQPRRRDPSEPLDEIEAKLFKVFRDNHIINAPEASQDMDMISMKTICKKCLLFRSVCQVIGHHVKDAKESQKMPDK